MQGNGFSNEQPPGADGTRRSPARRCNGSLCGSSQGLASRHLLLVIALLAICGCSTLDRYIFVLKKELPATPETHGIAYQESWFSSGDGVQLNGWFIPGTKGKPLVLFFHGNAGNLSDNLGYIKLLHGSGFPVFIFDYRGFGRSGGRPLQEKDLYSDARGALSYLSGKGWRPERMIFFGQSLGSAVALQMALETRPAGLVMESSFTSIAEMLKYASPLGYYMIGWWGINFPFDNLAKIARAEVPLLLIHGDKDPVVPVEMTRRLYGRASGPKMLQILSGGGHCDVFERDTTAYLAAWESYNFLMLARMGDP